MAQWTLERIAQKVRYLSLLIDANAATDDQVYERIDDFVLYDLPYNVQISILKKNIRFTCNPYIGRYTLDANAIVDELVNFDQKYTIIDQPMYCAGYGLRFYQDKALFESVYDNSRTTKTIGSGDGATDTFSATVTAPIAQYSVLVSSIDTNYGKIIAVDAPDNEDAVQKNNPETGGWRDSLAADASDLTGTINYISGELEVQLGSIPGNGQDVVMQYRQYDPARPQALLYYNSEIQLRPIPDKPYIIEFQAQVRPSQLDVDDITSTPELNQWGEYIAYGAAMKLLADKSNNERIEILRPDFLRLEDKIRVRTQRQRGTRRTYTMFAEQAENNRGPGSGNYYKEPY